MYIVYAMVSSQDEQACLRFSPKPTICAVSSKCTKGVFGGPWLHNSVLVGSVLLGRGGGSFDFKFCKLFEFEL